LEGNINPNLTLLSSKSKHSSGPGLL